MVKGYHCLPERPALLAPLIIIPYLQYASVGILINNEGFETEKL